MTADPALYCAHGGKRRFERRHMARTAARQTDKHASIYRCEHCGDYHVTHYPKRVQKAFRLLLGIES